MQLSIKYKLFLALLSAHIIVYAAMYSLGRYNFEQGFLEYISRIEERQVPALVAGLSDFYEHTGSWDTLRKNPQKWVALIRESIETTYEPASRPQQQRISDRPTPGGFSPNDWYYTSEYSPARPYLLLLDSEQNVIFGDPKALPLANLHAINARGKTAGYLAVTSRQELSEQADLLFAEQQKESFFYIALGLVLVSAVVAFPISSVLVSPVKEVVRGTRALTSGDYASRIPVRGSDELTRLAEDFNMLANTLEQNQLARQQWIADISHELRTPLAILRGELESIQDGVRPMNEDTLNSLHHEVVHLNSLVNDLHELSMSDLGALIYQKSHINLTDVLRQSLDVATPMLEDSDISLSLNIDSEGPQKDQVFMFGDAQRLEQLFNNLLQNTCRYTDAGGELKINVREHKDRVTIQWIDSEPGVSDKDLEHLFDRLYRVERSRSRNGGGSGLGLAICKNIVEAHEGSISASHSKLGGLALTITFPLKLEKH